MNYSEPHTKISPVFPYVMYSMVLDRIKRLNLDEPDNKTAFSGRFEWSKNHRRAVRMTY